MFTVTPNLIKATDWHNWIDTAQSLARSHKVWHLIDPDATDPLPLNRPSLPDEYSFLQNGQFTEWTKVRLQLRLEQCKTDYNEYVNRRLLVMKGNSSCNERG